MAIYRSDQAQLTFGTEATPGGYPELASSVTDGTGTARINMGDGLPAGSTEITVDNFSNITAGEFVQIGPTLSRSSSGTAANVTFESEIRKVDSVSGTTGITLELPTSFFHANDTDIQVVTAVSDTTKDKFITQIPGVYETVDLPDPEMNIEPRYFLGTASKRNFYGAYSGQQTYTGSVGSFVLLDGKPLRFPIGKVVSDCAATYTTNRTRLNGNHKKGDSWILVVDADNIAQDTYIGIDLPTALSESTTVSSVGEIRKVVTSAGSSHYLQLDYPLQYDHTAAGSGTTQVVNLSGSGVYYTHTILETTDLDSVTWHAHMKASNSTSSTARENEDFDRRYFGGKIGNATISAEEGGMLTMSWDSVNFLGMIHNQKFNSNYGSGATELPFYSLMETISSSDVDFPTTEPYYFSNGEVSMFGQTLARVRSFSLSVNNNEEPRYYIARQKGRRRGPSEIKENRREYGMSVSLALPDATSSTSATARTLFSELLLEGDYGSGKAGFNITLTFTRGTNDTITITIPDDGSAGTGGNEQGAFIRTAPHAFGTDNPYQVDADVLFRNLKITVVDSQHYYP